MDSDFLGVDKIKVNANISGVKLNCVPEILEVKPEMYTTCKLDTSYAINRNYVALLNIQAEYYYKETVEKQIKVTKKPN